jgi:thiamine biosynthesis lipoprotein
MMKKISILITLICFAAISCKQKEYTTVSNQALGTFYHVTYFDDAGRNFQQQIDSVLADFSNSLSAYDKNSLISKINQNIDTVADKHFTRVFDLAKYFHKITDGAFDISGSPLFSAWGFGFGNKEKITPQLIDSLKQFVGMDKIELKNGRIIKSDYRVKINANALAKGYAVDVVAEFLLSKGINNFLVEIGGEIVVRGKNSHNEKWKIGIDKPFDGNFEPGENIMNTLELTDEAIATSGNYRQFYIEDGKK